MTDRLVLLLLCLIMWLGAQAHDFPKVILRGDYPDPSILRDGNDFYMTHSPCDYAPGFLIWRDHRRAQLLRLQ